MNNTITIDTHLHAKNLKRVGFSDEQVDAQLALAQAQTDFINNNLATKADIFLIQRDIAELRKETKNDISLVQKDIAELRKETKQDTAGLYKHINTFGFLLCGLIIVGVSLLGILMAHYG